MIEKGKYVWTRLIGFQKTSWDDVRKRWNFALESSDRCDFVFILTAWIVMVLMDAGRSMSLWRVPPISWT